MSAITDRQSSQSSNSVAPEAAHDGTRLKWRPLDIAVGATLGVACGVIFWGFNFAYMPISSFLGAVLPGLASVTHAMWYFSGTLAVLVLRKPGAALYVNVVGTLVETVIGSQYGIGFVIVSALLQGVFAEIPFFVTRYRVFNLPVSIASGAMVALEYGFYLLFFRYQGVALTSPRGIVHMISEVTGGVVLSGVMPWFLMLALASTGVLDRLASGRALLRARPQA
ncbi:ECF transporter S component [Bifidobacterium stellenboschense]|uniref:ABC transporter permease n=1 Tax=Bifidobacterium stellenboschense TaxID=762211 RepID=A0A087DTC7_9BIFI|nr:ECF transporter S component [Bifidobacterium stellenboschense]KFI98777.1 ABC transporter permease [Bifidobacterium stellenboschense]